jgi:HK97 family phage major capsid protein
MESVNPKNSLQAKRMRNDLLNEMQSILDKNKTENRRLSGDEEKKYNELEKRFNELNEMALELEISEKRTLFGLETDKKTENGEDFGSLKVYSRSEKLADRNQVEGKHLSLGKAIRGLVTGSWDGAEAEKRAMDTTGAAATVPISLFANVFDLARAKSVFGRTSAQVIQMPTKQVTVARILSDPEFQAKAENDAFDLKDITVDGLVLDAKTVGVVCQLSRELAADSPNAASAIEKAISEALARELDRLWLFGSGDNNEPTGLNGVIGTQEIELSDALRWNSLIDAWGRLAAVNAEADGIVLSPRDRTVLQKYSKSDLGYYPRPELLNGIPLLHSSIVPVDLGASDNESIAFVGDWRNAMIGIREKATVEISTEAGNAFVQHAVLIKITFRGDIKFLKPNAFLKITKTKPTIVIVPEEL